jgi:D-arabinose 1-dehydrogenase-like Zn-dependent alcohol dehydrogenase
MKGIVYKGDKIAEIKDFPIPKPSKKEVVVKIKACNYLWKRHA